MWRPLNKEKIMAKKKNKKLKRSRRVPKGRRNLAVANYGDTIVIRNKSTVSAGICGVVMLSLIAVAAFKLKEAWNLPFFWAGLMLVVLGIVYSSVNAICSKIVLDSPKTLISVYRPFEKQYKFSDVNYVDVTAKKSKDKPIAYTVILYIGNGKRTVEVTTYSEDQADELVSLFRGMLDNGAMEYPEGDEEPFHFDDDEKKSGFTFLKRKKNTEPEAGVDETDVKAPEKSDDASLEEKRDESENSDSDDDKEE